MEHTSRKTSLALKNVGFPQPQRSDNGFWWIGSGEHPISYQTHRITVSGHYYLSEIENAVYAPSALEIMEAMPSTGARQITLVKGGKRWEVRVIGNQIPRLTFFSHENPAEALASAYFFLHNQSAP